MDIVYILGSKSVWQNNEIRFSLRSLEKNVSDLGNVFIIGERPEWLKNIIHIPAKDPFPVKWKNAYYKISIACRDDKIAPEFLLMNDDFFIVKGIEAQSYPYYYNRTSSRKNNIYSRRFKTTWEKTASILQAKNKGSLNFAVHRPFRYKKEEFLAMPEIPLSELGFSVRSFYANYWEKKGVPSKDPLISPLQNIKDFEKLCSQYTDFSIFSSTARSPVFKNWIRGRFPKKSRFEK